MIIVSVMWPPPPVQFAFAVKLRRVLDINSTFYMTLANLCWGMVIALHSWDSLCPQICYATWYFSQHQQSAINTVHHNKHSYKTNQVWTALGETEGCMWLWTNCKQQRCCLWCTHPPLSWPADCNVKLQNEWMLMCGMWLYSYFSFMWQKMYKWVDLLWS